MNHIHDNKVNYLSEFNLLYYILNTSKHTKNINSHRSPILHVCMNTRKGKVKFNNFRILLDSRCGSTFVYEKGNLKKLNLKKIL